MESHSISCWSLSDSKPSMMILMMMMLLMQVWDAVLTELAPIFLQVFVDLNEQRMAAGQCHLFGKSVKLV